MCQTKTKYGLFILYTLIFIQIGFTQNGLSSSSVLATAKTQTAVVLKERKIEVMSAMTDKLPFFETMEFQTGTDFLFQKQQVRAKALFNGPQEIKSLKLKKVADKTREQTDRTVLFQNALLDRYALLVEHHFANKSLMGYRKLQELFLEKRNILQQMATLTANFNVEDLIKAEDATFEYQQKIFEAEGMLRNTYQYLTLNLNLGDSLLIDTTDWIPLSTIRGIAFETSYNVDKNPLLAQQNAAIGVIQSDYNLEKAQLKKVIDNVQIQNSVLSNEFVTKNWGIAIGLLIPYRGSSKMKLDEITLKRLDEENKLKMLQNSLALQVFNLRQDLNLIFSEYDLIKKQTRESQTTYSLEQYSKVQGVSPVTMLRMQELILAREEKLTVLEHTAYLKYIKLLDLTGKLSEMPLKNYLSVGLTEF